MKALVLCAVAVALLDLDIWSCGSDPNYDPSPITPLQRPEGDGKPPPGPPGTTPPPFLQQDAPAADAQVPPAAPPTPAEAVVPAPKKSGDWEILFSGGSANGGGACYAKFQSTSKGAKWEASAKFLTHVSESKDTLSKKDADALWARLDAEKWWAIQEEKNGGITIKMGKFSRSFTEATGTERIGRVAEILRKVVDCDALLLQARTPKVEAKVPRKKKR
jgi:hypothetical protein